MNKKKLMSIVERLVEARRAYEGTGQSIMTDPEYDSLENLVREHDPDNPFFETVGHPASSPWQKADHKIFMGSLEKVHTEEEFIKWVSKFDEGTVFCLQYKLDGLSLSLDYEYGDFVKGTTRGDGTTGEDIFENVVLMKGFKNSELYIFEQDFSGSIRAEILLNKENFEKINAILPEKDKYSNPRSAASGISRRLDGRFCKFLQIVAYDISESLDEPIKIQHLKNLGFATPLQVVGDYKEIIAAYDHVVNDRETLPFDIDGVVIKAVSHEVQKAMGISRKKPKGQTAWKFEAPGAATTFLKEVWDVGRTGVVTPLANLEPTLIDGSTIRKATLHNVGRVIELNLGRGDTVMLVKRGDIIPHIESVLISVYMCPECGFKGSLKEQEKYHVEK